MKLILCFFSVPTSTLKPEGQKENLERKHTKSKTKVQISKSYNTKASFLSSCEFAIWR